MDYGIEVPSYRRVDNKKEKGKLSFEKGLTSLILTLFAGIMLSRVGFGFVEGLYLSQFGIAFFLAIIKKSDIRKCLLTFVAISIGYLTGESKAMDITLYIAISAVILLYKFIYKRLKKEFNNIIMFLLIVITSISIGLLLGEQSTEINLIFSISKAVIIIPIFYIVNYAVGCIQEINTNNFYSTEE